MKYYVGMDHGTTAVSFQIIDENKDDVGFIRLPRDKLADGSVNFRDEMEKLINISDIDLLCMCYAMGDNICEITPISEVENHAVKSIHGAGKITGAGSGVYQQIEHLNIPTVLVPGLHRDCEFLDERFRASYSHCASAEKVSLTYYAYRKLGLKNMIISDVSSNTVCVMLKDGEIKAALDACIGAMGFIHGPLDLEMIRDIDEGKYTANECFSNAGVLKIAKIDADVVDVKDKLIKKAVDKDKDAVVAIKSLVMGVVMEIHALASQLNEVDGIVLTGSAGCMRTPVDISGMIKDEVKSIAPVHIITDRSGAIGSSLIAYDIKKRNVDNIMGIKVKK